MASGVCHEKGRAIVRRALPMKNRLHPMPDRMCLLSLCDVTLLDMDNVNAWFEAIDMSSDERRDACKMILSDGSFAVCNIEHRLEVCCHSR